MWRQVFRVIGFLVLLAAAPSIAAGSERNMAVASPNGGRVALVIGNAAYPGVAALRNPANDANDIAAKLGKLGFDVTIKVNVGLKEMLRALTAFGNRVKPGSEVLVFYAGHGMQVRGKNYLIPIDAEIGNESAVSSEAVDVDQLLDKLGNARLSMVILDACRNNPFERRFRGYGQGLAQINAPTGTLIAYSTAPGKVASDGDGRNGLYTQELLAALDTPGIRVEDVFKRVRVNVVRRSGEAQTPWESSSLTGDFYFDSRVSALPALQPVPPAGSETSQAVFPNDAEAMMWSAVEQSDDTADYEIYLSQYPKGRFVAAATARIERLKLARMETDEINLWRTAEKGSRTHVEAYLERYPQGRYAGMARLRLARLQAEESQKASKIEQGFIGSWAWNGDMNVQFVIFKTPSGALGIRKGEQYSFFAAAPRGLTFDGERISIDFPFSPLCTFKLISPNRMEGACGQEGQHFMTRIDTTTRTRQ